MRCSPLWRRWPGWSDRKHRRWRQRKWSWKWNRHYIRGWVLPEFSDIPVSNNRSKKWGEVAQDSESVEEDGGLLVSKFEHIEEIENEHSWKASLIWQENQYKLSHSQEEAIRRRMESPFPYLLLPDWTPSLPSGLFPRICSLTFPTNRLQPPRAKTRLYQDNMLPVRWRERFIFHEFFVFVESEICF